jgi:HPt (histidine-containing phosphotransfer) domain-containing protein
MVGRYGNEKGTEMTQPTTLHLADALDELDRQFSRNGLCGDAAAELRRLHRECEILSIERDHARIMYENAVKLLTSIHSCIYPNAVKMEDGRVMVFRPENPHEYLQALSDRIRALPDEIAAIAKREQNDKPQGKLLPWKGLTEEEHTYYKACGFVGVKAVEEKLRARNSTLACHQGEEGK